jgi:hypothetical protein
MSLFSILSGSTTSTSTSTSNALASPLQQLLASSSDDSTDLTATLASLTASSTSSSVQITSSAKVAAADKADADKDAATIASETRAALDAQTGSTPDLSEMSGRALGVIILNDSGQFSRAEVYAAKQELKQRDRNELLSALSGGLSLDAISAYQSYKTSEKQSMSTEERQARAMMG